MLEPMAKRRNRVRTVRVGARVKLVFGVAQVTATVIEDRGNLAVGGRRLWRVRLDMPDTNEPFELEVPASDLEIIAA